MYLRSQSHSQELTMPIVAKSCLFCGAGGAGVLSKEHVIPQWLLKHLELPADDKLFQGVASSADGTLSQTPRIHSSFNFVQGHVCEECNNGWMSQLEAAAKPILVPLIDGERTIESLAEEEAQIVGKWTCKTAYMHSWASPLDSPGQQDHLQALFGNDGKAMPGVTVVGSKPTSSNPAPTCRRDIGHTCANRSSRSLTVRQQEHTRSDYNSVTSTY